MLLEEKKRTNEVLFFRLGLLPSLGSRQAIRSLQAQREEADVRLEHRWQNQAKEESSLRRAVESHLEQRLVALQKEVRMEASRSASRATIEHP